MNDATKRSAVSRRALWFGLLGGAAAWMLHLMSAYAASEFGCVGRLGDYRYWNISLVAWFVLGVTVFAALVSVTATAVAYGSHRRLSQAGAIDRYDAAEQSTAWTGFLTSGLFTVAIVFESIPILFYLRCC